MEELTEAEGGHIDPHQRVGTRLPAFRQDERPLVVFDWATAGLDVTFDGVVVTQVKRVEDLAELLGGVPHKIVTESSFEPYVLGRRKSMTEMLRDAGHEIYSYNQRQTSRYRRANGIDKSNENDARAIYALAATTNLHLRPLQAEPDADWVERRKALNQEYLIIKFNGWKPEMLIKPAKAILGRYKLLSEEKQWLYGNGKPDKYSETMLAAVYFATSRTTNRDEFERLLGLYQAGYPSLLRSDIHHHAYRTNRIKRNMPISDFRHGCRMMRADFMAAGVGAPEPETDGTVEPS
jgi:hypothetical protein